MIRAAKKYDMPEIMRVYEAARKFMAESGNESQWGQTYPPAETVAEDIENNRLFVLDSGGIHGAFVFFFGTEPDYERVEGGSWQTASPSGIMHRVASDGATRGFFSQALSFCLSRAREIRIDTHRDNTVMQHVLEKNGFCRVGIVYIENGEERIAYEFAQKKCQ